MKDSHIKGAHRILDAALILVPTEVLAQDPCLVGQPRILTLAHFILVRTKVLTQDPCPVAVAEILTCRKHVKATAALKEASCRLGHAVVGRRRPGLSKRFSST